MPSGITPVLMSRLWDRDPGLRRVGQQTEIATMTKNREGTRAMAKTDYLTRTRDERVCTAASDSDRTWSWLSVPKEKWTGEFGDKVQGIILKMLKASQGASRSRVLWDVSREQN